MLKGVAICVLVFGILVFLAGIIVPPSLLAVFQKAVERKVVIDSEDHGDFKDWSTNTDPDDPNLYYIFYFYNVTNLEEIRAGGQIKVREVGPYYYRIWQTKYNISFIDNNNKVKFNLREWYEFVPSLSNGTESDVLVLANPSYASAIMRLGSESNMRVVLLGGVMAKTFQGVMALRNIQADNFYALWGTFSGTRFGGNATSLYLMYSEFLEDNLPPGIPGSLFSMNATQAKEFLVGANGLLTVDPKTGTYRVATFLSLLNPCAATNYSTDSPACQAIVALWGNQLNPVATLRSSQLRALGGYFLQFIRFSVTPLLNNAITAAGGGAFQTRTVRQWTVDPNPDPLLTLLGRPALSFLCGNDSGSNWNQDPCDRGYQIRWTGRDDVVKAQSYYADRSMDTAPALGANFCTPFKSCGDQKTGVWLGPLEVHGHHPGLQGPGKTDRAYGWENRINSQSVLGVWSETLYRNLTFLYYKDSSVGDVTTYRFNLDASIGKIDPFYFTSIRALLNRTSQAQGLPLFAVPNHLIGMTPEEIAPLLQVQVTLVDGCVTGQGKCYTGDLAAYYTYLEVEPISGNSLEIRERLTTTLMMPKYIDGAFGNLRPGTAALNNATLVPLLSADKFSRFKDNKLDDMKRDTRYPRIARIILIVCLVLGFVLIVVGVGMVVALL
eukprot:TRINITY_DN5210_c0_g4_i3.p1 TRINITY_DN5210_c0_g4~~TRINITY_DN5210_c0_g4_i3.p1  ORF type:complete len:666 (+),score=182.44 TRINITY_DN5210_c0_g4_i3:75-2072(+)